MSGNSGDSFSDESDAEAEKEEVKEKVEVSDTGRQRVGFTTGNCLLTGLKQRRGGE